MEYCLNIEPYRQPVPNKNPGGDCFACALTAALRYLFPDNHPSFETVWNYFMGKSYGGSDVLQNTWPGMQKAITNATRDGYRLSQFKDIIQPKYDLDMFSYTFFNFVPDMEYTYRLEGWLRSGWIPLTEINYHGVTENDRRKRSNDHFILLDGVRVVWEDNLNYEGSRTLRHYTHVVCSAKGGYWIRTDELLEKHGAAGWMLIRNAF